MISVIIPLYNKEAIIERSLRSVLSQDYDDFEVVIVDDGSTDRSADIVRSIKDDRIRLYSQENGGPSKARNTGVRYAKGEWIVFLDADDEFLPGALSRFAQMIAVNPNSGFVACPYYHCNREKKMAIVDNTLCGVIRKPFKSFYYKDINPRMGSYALPKEIALACPFNEDIRRFEDDEHLLKVFNFIMRDVKKYVIYNSVPSMIENLEFAAASHGRKDIKEDFLGHIDFKGKCFWEKMCLYKFFLGERPYYHNQCLELYPHLNRRFDLLILHKILYFLHR